MTCSACGTLDPELEETDLELFGGPGMYCWSCRMVHWLEVSHPSDYMINIFEDNT